MRISRRDCLDSARAEWYPTPGPVAQLVEQRTFNPTVRGSSPRGLTVPFQALTEAAFGAENRLGNEGEASRPVSREERPCLLLSLGKHRFSYLAVRVLRIGVGGSEWAVAIPVPDEFDVIRRSQVPSRPEAIPRSSLSGEPPGGSGYSRSRRPRVLRLTGSRGLWSLRAD